MRKGRGLRAKASSQSGSLDTLHSSAVRPVRSVAIRLLFGRGSVSRRQPRCIVKKRTIVALSRPRNRHRWSRIRSTPGAAGSSASVLWMVTTLAALKESACARLTSISGMVVAPLQ